MSTPAPHRPSDDGREGPLPEARAWNIVSTLLAGLITFGGIGLLAGTALAFYLIWFRYGTR
jgi:hypothetical protein